ncbi:DMT family transporter [uncultured Bacteroides sp.]|uniref:DMT family transporter n=1 Tax=uncultured Bacteroides sp. TaxID=162156 RepID=UPI002AA69C0C|nr:DMT family transporter [uncultured Bacteroides sp.]
MKQETKAIVCAGVAVLSWSTVASAFKIALMHLTPFGLLLVASCTALLIFTCTITLQRKWPLVRALCVKQWKRFAWMGLLNPVIYYLVLFRAYNLLPAQIAQPLNYTWPILLLVLLSLFSGQPIPRKKYAGMLLSLSGVALISFGSGGLNGQGISVTGVLLAFLSAFLWAAYWMFTNRNKKVDAIVALFANFLFGSLYLLIAACVAGVDLSSLYGLLSGMYVGAFEISVPFVCFGLAIRNTNNPALINQMCYLSPFLSLFFIQTVLGEQIVLSTYIGLALIISGIVFNESQKHAVVSP